ncbi:transposase [Piscirickettsia salmonis]|uniref:transposase n=1 Tax=Piscirickettsia salmonis TaxID=1238 RepID=UPI003A811387
MHSPLYPDNVSNSERTLISNYLVNSKKRGGRPPKYGKRVMFNAILYLLRTECSWRHLRKDFPPWKSVYTQYRSWVKCNIFARIHAILRNKLRSFCRNLKFS